MRAQADLRHYIGILLHWAWLLILAATVAGTLGYALSVRQPPVYQASTTLSIQEAPGTTVGSELQSLNLSQQRVDTYVELLRAKPLLATVSQQLGIAGGIPKSAISVSPVGETQLIRVSARSSDPQLAAAIANTLAVVFADQRRQVQSERYAASKQNLQQRLTELEQQIDRTTARLEALGPADSAERDRLEPTLAGYQEVYASLLQSFEQVRLAEAQATSTVVQEEVADVPSRPVAPRVLNNTALAALVGLMIVLGFVLLRDKLDDTVKDPDELSRLSGLPVLGRIAHLRRGEGGRPAVAASPRSAVAEAFRTLRTNIQFTSVERPLQTLMVTSPSPGDGKSTTVVNLGAVLAQGDRKVILLDADLRRPTLHKRLEISNRTGLSDLFVQPDAHLNGTLRQTPVESVSIISAGAPPPNPAELLGSHKMVEILDEVRRSADVVVIDSAPVNAVTDSVVLAPHVDGVLLVVRAGVTKLSAAKQAVEQLARGGARIIGIVINDIPLGRSEYGLAYQYYHRAYHGPDEPEGNGRPGLLRWPGRRQRVEQQVDQSS